MFINILLIYTWLRRADAEVIRQSLSLTGVT